MKDRLKKKLKAKKNLARQRLKPILPYVTETPPQEFEMPEGYRQYLQTLTEMIEERDHYAREIPNLPPDLRAQAQPALAELSRAIENLEQRLADEYERYQAEKRKESEISAHINRGMEAVENLFIHFKNNVPHRFKEFEKIVIQGMTPEEVEEFYDRVAIREAEMKKNSSD